jgi:hypothetical protein
MNNRIGVHEAPGLLKEGGGVMNKIQSENLSQKQLPAVVKHEYPVFLNNGSVMAASCSGRQWERGFRTNRKGGEEKFVSDQKITSEEKKQIVTLIRRMEVKQ